MHTLVIVLQNGRGNDGFPPVTSAAEDCDRLYRPPKKRDDREIIELVENRLMGPGSEDGQVTNVTGQRSEPTLLSGQCGRFQHGSVGGDHPCL